MTSVTIEPADVIRLLEQYLKENNLHKTLQSLQEETSVHLNTVDSIETFVHDINSGNWDVVLKVVKLLNLPANKLVDLYEQIAIELIELRETRAANWLIHKTEPLLNLKSAFPDRYLHLQNLLGRPFFEYKEAFRDGLSKERRRNAIAQSLKSEVTVVPAQRLLTLLGDALKWQRQEGLLPTESSIDIFTGKVKLVQAEEENHPNLMHKHCVKSIKPDGGGDEDDSSLPIFVSCAEFSPDGHYLVVGYSTGLIEIRNSSTGRMANDLKYQAQKSFLITPNRSAALSLCFSQGELLAVGDMSGDISVWQLSSGLLVQHFKSAHLKSVSCLEFHTNGKEILSGSHDKTAKSHGMRSNKTIRDFVGHKSLVNSIALSRDSNNLVTGSSDSTVKIWNAKTAQLLHDYKSPARVHSVLLMPNFKNDYFLIGSQGTTIHIIDIEGKLRTKLVGDNPSSVAKEDQDEDEASSMKQDLVGPFYATCLSPRGSWIYTVDSKFLYCFYYSSKKVMKRLQVHMESSNDLIGVKHHPFLNIVATYDTVGNLKLWKP